MPIDFAKVRRVLIYRLGSLGDTLVALPCFHLIAQAFPDAEAALLTNVPVSSKVPGVFDLLQPAGLVHTQLRYPVGTRSPKELWELRKRIRDFAPDVLVSVISIRSALSVWRDTIFFKSCGIPHLIGMPYSKSMRTCLPQSEGGSIEREASRLARCLRALGDAHIDDPATWSLNLTPAEHAKAAEALKPISGRPLIGVSLGTKVQAKDWGEANWTDLMNVLAADFPDHGLVLIGAGVEGPLSERAASAWSGRYVNLCGALTARETAAALARTNLFIGHDSGPMHLAASVQRPCVAIFAARNIPQQWYPFGDGHRIIYHKTDCMGCGLETCIKENKKCITSITVGEVRHAVHDILFT